MILVTGASGTLGRLLVPTLTRRGSDVRALSRRARAGGGPGGSGSFEWAVGDLGTGAGLDEAVDGIDVIVHAASNTRGQGKGDADAVWRLMEAAKRGGRRPHLVYISIVGVDRVPYAYYKAKHRVEEIVEDGGVPWTILRATQFHDFLVQMFTWAARTGLLPVLAGTSFQPVALDDVAGRLTDLVDGPAQGRASDLGGPEIRPMADLARAWLAASGRRRVVVPVRLPGAIARGYRDGAHLTPEHADGVVTFEQFLAARAEVAR